VLVVFGTAIALRFRAADVGSTGVQPTQILKAKFGRCEGPPDPRPTADAETAVVSDHRRDAAVFYERTRPS